MGLKFNYPDENDYESGYENLTLQCTEHFNIVPDHLEHMEAINYLGQVVWVIRDEELTDSERICIIKEIVEEIFED